MSNNIITDFFGVCYGDAEYIQNLIDEAVDVGVDMDDAFDIFAEYFDSSIFMDNRIATFTNLIIESIYQAVFNKAIEDLNDYCSENGFEPFADVEPDPYINCLDSRMYVIFEADYDNPDCDFINSYLDNEGDIDKVLEEDSDLVDRLEERKQDK